MDNTSKLEALAEEAKAALGDAILGTQFAFGELTLAVRRDAIVDAVTMLRDKAGFVSIVDVCGVDYPEREERFDVVYHLLSPTRNIRVRLKVTTDEVEPVPSITGVFPGADWFEREAYDLYGMLFSGHPD